MNKKASTKSAKSQDEEARETESTKESEGRRGAEQKLDELGDKFSKAMSEGVKRMEEAFERGIKNLQENPSLASGGWKAFLTSASGGMFLVIIGLVWLLMAMGWLNNPILPIIVIILGFYFVLRKRT